MADDMHTARGNMRICVIGGGPAGLTAAARAAEKGATVTLLERGERVGRKILQTGNGKCNYTNRVLTPECYHAAPESFAMKALALFGPKDTIRRFRELGIEPLELRDGYFYPHSGQAASVLNALRQACETSGVRMITACEVRNVMKRGDQFRIRTDRELLTADRLILATGSRAGAGKDADDAGLGYAEAFGHRVIRPLPALCSMACAEKEFFQSVAGVRVLAEITLFLDGREADRAVGEVQLTAYGLSGIPVFQVSRTAARALSLGRKVEARIDFLPDAETLASGKTVREWLDERASRTGAGTLELFGNGLLNKNLWNGLLKRSGLKPGGKTKELTDEQKDSLLSSMRGSRFRVIRTAGFDQAQTATGGVDTREIDPLTMESRLVPGLYFAGEMIDVDGICGGYNLQWCWTSGEIAGGLFR